MNDGHDPIHALPGPLPPGETLLWSGKPTTWALARHVYHVHAVLIYFALLAVYAVGVALADGAAWQTALMGVAAPLPLALPTLGLLAAASYLTARTTTYHVTERRIILQVGVGITKTVNIPLGRVLHVEVRDYADGSRDIALTLGGTGKIAYAALWPHVRPWRFSKPQPMLRGLASTDQVERVLGDALMRATPGIRHAARAPQQAPRPVPTLGRPVHG